MSARSGAQCQSDLVVERAEERGGKLSDTGVDGAEGIAKGMTVTEVVSILHANVYLVHPTVPLGQSGRVLRCGVGMMKGECGHHM